ncbi:hypothetical protein TNCV_38771 [Trichonephila clavipes]|nr:hypothetical protein TNCV_38771 [Trichonephila clavipes]
MPAKLIIAATDRKSGQKFLIDLEVKSVSVPHLSPTMNKSPQSNFSLFAANNPKIPAHGMVRKELNSGTGWRDLLSGLGIIADASSPTSGANLLKALSTF